MAENEEKVELPEPLVRFKKKLEDERKKLLKEKVYADPEQLRQFIAQYAYPAMLSMVEMFGTEFVYQYNATVSNAQDIMKVRRWTARHLQAVGVDVDDEAGVSLVLLNELAQECFALGSILEKKLPGDAEVEGAFNAVTTKLQELYTQVQAAAEREDEEDDEEDDEDDDDRDDEDDDREDDDDADAPKDGHRTHGAAASDTPAAPAPDKAPDGAKS